MAKTCLERNGNLEVAGVAPKKIFGSCASPNGGQRGSLFVFNPTSGTLEVRADLRLKVEQALRAEARRFQLRLYLRLAGLYISQLSLQARYARLRVLSYFGG
jgi:hypothetical protein